MAPQLLFKVDDNGSCPQVHLLRTTDVERRTLIVENPNLEGLKVEAIPGRREAGVTVSRIRRAGEAEVHLAAGGTVLKNGDRIVAVGTGAVLDRFQQVGGTSKRRGLSPNIA
jgi:putative transport protein